MNTPPHLAREPWVLKLGASVACPAGGVLLRAEAIFFAVPPTPGGCSGLGVLGGLASAPHWTFVKSKSVFIVLVFSNFLYLEVPVSIVGQGRGSPPIQ